MNNYEYIIASLPVLTTGYRYAEGSSFRTIVDEIRGQLSTADAAALDLLLRGFDPDALDTGFYTQALSHRNGFIREYFRFDLHLRNTKVRYLNAALGRPADTDFISGKAADDEAADPEGYLFRAGEFEEAPKAELILTGSDLLGRERALDDLVWDKIDRLTTFHYFDLDAVLGFVSRLHIVDRWLVLDEKSGRALFRRLVEEIQSSFRQPAYIG